MRTLSRLVGMGLCLLGAAPLVWAQQAASSPVTVCLPCHGGGAAAAAAAPGAPAFPTLDGQHAAYLDTQLREYLSGTRKSPIMAPLIASLKKQQISGIAAHVAGQTPARGTPANPELVARGKLTDRGVAGVCGQQHPVPAHGEHAIGDHDRHHVGQGPGRHRQAGANDRKAGTCSRNRGDRHRCCSG